MNAKAEDYQSLSSELERVLAALQQPNVQVDDAVKLYEQGLNLAAKLEKQLREAENTIQKLQLQAGAGERPA
ncbi:MAG TPA: exodeoxyribonuclease VII small subunit [Candidatus Saccharimonadales bacterium]|nr:exodeoxyribonuclease VII small subunit [Candidatus Saccharimonadales bacterium]